MKLFLSLFLCDLFKQIIYLFIYLFIYLLAVLGLCCGTWVNSSCVHRFLLLWHKGFLLWYVDLVAPHHVGS